MRLLLPLLLAFLGFVAGGVLGGLTVPAGSGLAGGAVVLAYGVGGALIGLIAGTAMSVKLGPAGLRLAVRVSAGLAAVVAILLGLRLAAVQRAEEEPTDLSPTTVPAEPVAQRYPTLDPSELPLGLGVARIAPSPGRVLRFYGEPREGDRPGDLPPVDSVTFGPGVPSVDIATAPPWLVPEHLKMDYELFVLRAITLTPDWIEVVGNSTTGRTWWIGRAAADFVGWPRYLLSMHSVEALDAEGNPVRYRPHDEADVLSTRPAPLQPLAVRGEWLRVATGELADRIQPSGWIRWRAGDRLLVSCNPLS